MDVNKTEAPGLERWREKLSGTDIPAFARTVREISSVASDRASSARDLSDVVSQDAAIAARLIQISNSSLFNVTNKPIDTISSAIVRVGFDTVRELALSVSVLDSMMTGSAHSHVGALMGHAFHAAAQAKSIATLKGEKPEEVFVGALLRDVGALAFWSHGEDLCAQLHMALAKGQNPDVAQQSLLGFTLSELSTALASDWELGELVQRAHDDRYAGESRFACVQLGHDLAEAIEKFGWDNEATQTLLDAIAKELQIDKKALLEICESNYEAASALSEKLGISPAFVPDPPTPHVPSWAELKEHQQGTLQAIADGIENEQTRDELMTLLVAGLIEGFSAHEAYFALTNADRSKLIVKYATGDDASPILGAHCIVNENRLFSRALNERKAFISPTPAESPWHAGGPALVSGVHISGKPVGVLYVEVESEISAEEISANYEAAFRQFVQQVALILTQAS